MAEKPKFNPNAEYDVLDDKKPAFNPSEKYEVVKKKESTTSPSSNGTSPSPSAKFDPTKFVTLPTGQDFKRPEDRYEDPTGENRKAPPKKEKKEEIAPIHKPKVIKSWQEAKENAPESQTQINLPDATSLTPETKQIDAPVKAVPALTDEGISTKVWVSDEEKKRSLSPSQEKYAIGEQMGEINPKTLLYSFAKGVTSSVGDVVKGMGIPFYEPATFTTKNGEVLPIPGLKKPEGVIAYRLGKMLDEFGSEAFPLRKEDQQMFLNKLAQGGGSIIPYIYGGIASKAFKIPQWITPTIMGSLQNAASQYQDAKANGADDDTAMDAYYAGLAVGSLEGLPIANMMKRMNGVSGGLFNSTLTKKLESNIGASSMSMIEESAQEMTTQILNNATAASLYDTTRSLWDGVAESGMIGGILGKVAGAMTSTLKNKLQDPNLTISERVIVEKSLEFAESKERKMEGVESGDFVKVDDDTKEVIQLKQKKTELESDMGDPNIAEGVKEQIGEKINEVDAQIEAAKADVVEQDRQVVETQGAIAELESQKDDLQSQIDNSSPATQEILMPQMQQVLDELDALKVSIPQEVEQTPITPSTNVEEKTEPTIGQEVLSEQPPISTQNVPLANEVNNTQSVEAQKVEEVKVDALKDVESTTKALGLEKISDNELQIIYDDLSISKNRDVRILSNMVENIQEKKERNSILDSPLENVSITIDNVLKKEHPFLEKKDARESKEVAKKYLGEVSKQEAKKDFRDAFFGSPNNWIADALKMRESVRVFVENGGTFKDLLSSVQKEFDSDGFTEQEAASVIKNKLESLAKQDFRQRQISEAYHKAKKDGSNPELVKAVEDLLSKDQSQNVPLANEVNIQESIKQYEQERVLSDNDTKTEKGQPTESDKPIEGEKGKSKQGFTEGETLAKESGFDKVIDFLENLKADNKNKLNAFGILPEVWNAAISGLQDALKAGKSVTKALDGFIKELKDKEQTFDEKQVRDVVQGAIEKGMQTKPKTTEKVEEKKEDEQVTKVKTREKSLFKRAYEGTPDDEMKSLISEYGLNYEIESHDKAQQAAKDFVQEVGPEEALEAVRKNMIEDGAAAFVWAEIIDKVEIELSTESNPENISKLQKYQRDLIDEFDRKARSGGRFISALQRIYRDSLFNYKADVQIERYKAVNNGEIPSDIEQKFRDLENQLKEVNEKLKEAEIAAEKAREELAIANIKESVERENKANKSSKQKAKEIANAIRKGKTNRPNIFMSSSPAAIAWDGAVEAVAKAIEADESIAKSLSKGLEYIKNSKWYEDLSEDKKSEAESAFKQYIKDKDPNKINVEVIDGKIKIPHKLIRQKVSEGITDPEALAQSVLDDIKSEYPDLTIRQVRDAISNYGKTVNPSQDEVEIKIRKIKRIQRIISALEDVSAKKRPLRSGQQRDKLDAEERAKMKELREAMKELPLDEETQAKQLKTALDAVKSRLRNAIEDIQRQIETGERSSKKGTIEYDQEAKDLLAEKERLQALRDEIFGKPELTTEQKIDRATKGLDRSIRELERRINEKDFSSPTKEPISSPEIEIRKARQKSLREQLQALREEIGVAEQKRLEAAKKRAESQIAELERRLRERDFSKKQKKTTKEDEELGELRAKKVRIQQEFEKEQYKNELKNRNSWAKISDILLELVNIPRALRATAEMSPVLIQGGVQTISQLARNPKSVIRAFTELGKGWWSESKANEWMNKLIASKEYPAMEQAGLSISKPNAKLAAREELYLSGLINTLWEKIGLPLKVLGEKPYDLWKAANPFMKFERAGTAYLNTLRVERFVQGMRMLEIQGKSPSTHPQEYKALAKVINTLTGRTSLGKAETIAKPLSLIFFSPRNLASTLKQATFLPLMAEGRNKDGTIKPSVAQKIAFTDFMTYMIAVGGIVAMIKNAYEDDDDKDAPKVNTDPRSSEFMTIKIGNSVIDPWHGLKQYVVLAARLYTGQTVNTKGDVKELGSGPYVPTEGKLLYRTLFQYKLSPTASMLEKYWTAPRKKINGEYVKVDEFTKQPLNMLDQTTQNLYPIYWDTFSEVNKENPTEVAAFLNTLAFFGIGLNVYDSENTKNKKQSTEIPKGVILFKPPK